MVKSGQVVVLTVPDQPVGGDPVVGARPAEDLLLGHIVLKVPEGDLPPGGEGRMELVDGIVDALVHGLGPARHIDLPLELAGLVDTGEPLQLADEGPGSYLA